MSVIGALFAASVGCGPPAGEPTAVNAQVEPLVAQVWTTDTTPTTSLPKITYVQLPTNDAALPLNVDVPARVSTGDDFTVRVECGAALAGDQAHVSLLAVRDARPPNWVGAGGIDPRFADGITDGSGAFEAIFRASPGPQTVYVFASCTGFEWISDALIDDGEGGYLVSYYYYPPERLVEVRIVADSGPAGTLPRSL